MNPIRSDEIATGVVAYCEAIEIPDFDEAAFAARHPVFVRRTTRRPGRLRLAMSIAAAVALFGVLFNIHEVVASVRHVFAAFSTSTGRAMPLTIRAVDLKRARIDMPFAVIEPPSIVDAPRVTVDELYPAAATSEASIVFHLRGFKPEMELTIIESRASKPFRMTLFDLRDTSVSGSEALHSLESQAPLRGQKPKLVLRESETKRTFAPATWIAHGTRIVVVSSPGFLSNTQLQSIRRTMSR